MTVDKEGWPIRDRDSTSYAGAVETADEFGYRIYTEASRESAAMIICSISSFQNRGGRLNVSSEALGAYNIRPVTWSRREEVEERLAA